MVYLGLALKAELLTLTLQTYVQSNSTEILDELAFLN